jgi:hypothetical protein
MQESPAYKPFELPVQQQQAVEMQLPIFNRYQEEFQPQFQPR